MGLWPFSPSKTKSPKTLSKAPTPSSTESMDASAIPPSSSLPLSQSPSLLPPTSERPPALSAVPKFTLSLPNSTKSGSNNYNSLPDSLPNSSHSHSHFNTNTTNMTQSSEPLSPKTILQTTPPQPALRALTSEGKRDGTGNGSRCNSMTLPNKHNVFLLFDVPNPPKSECDSANAKGRGRRGGLEGAPDKLSHQLSCNSLFGLKKRSDSEDGYQYHSLVHDSDADGSGSGGGSGEGGVDYDNDENDIDVDTPLQASTTTSSSSSSSSMSKPQAPIQPTDPLDLTQFSHHTKNRLTNSRFFVNQVKAVFVDIDIDKTGTLTPSELYIGVLKLHLNLSKYLGPSACNPPPIADVDRMFLTFDIDGDGEINLPEFLCFSIILFETLLLRVLIQCTLMILVFPPLAKYTFAILTSMFNTTVAQLCVYTFTKTLITNIYVEYTNVRLRENVVWGMVYCPGVESVGGGVVCAGLSFLVLPGVLEGAGRWVGGGSERRRRRRSVSMSMKGRVKEKEKVN